MGLAARVVFTILLAQISAPASAQPDDESLKVYAVKIVKTTPWKAPFAGYGTYLGGGFIITAAHVIGRWPFLTRPRVIIAGQELAAVAIKQGSFPQMDVALLSVDESALPISLRLRRNPLCKEPARIGLQVVDVTPEKAERAQVISSTAIAPQLRQRFNTLINTVEVSGSGLFDVERKCFVGLVSAKISRRDMREKDATASGFVGYFVPASTIADFLPPEFRF
jgi:hypothetical protein